MAAIFDEKLRALRRDRAYRHGPETFMFDRAFRDVEERLALFRRSFERALLIGVPSPLYAERLHTHVRDVDILDPGSAFANAAGGSVVIEDRWQGPVDHYDLCVAFGTLDTANNLPEALLRLRLSLRSEGVLIGVMAGGNSLPALRSAMHAADQVSGASAPHIHPRVDPATLGQLLTQCGFADPVVDIDRIDVAYSTFDSLIGDLRRMGATNVMLARLRTSIGKRALQAARDSFEALGRGKTIETFELLNFAAVAAPQSRMPRR